MCSKCNKKNAVNLLGSMPGIVAHGHMFCSKLTFYRRDRGRRRAKKKAKDGEGDVEGKKKISEGFKVENQWLLYVKRPEGYSNDSRRKDFFDTSVPETRIRF